jgi:hypothetical protein
MTNGVLEF